MQSYNVNILLKDLNLSEAVMCCCCTESVLYTILSYRARIEDCLINDAQKQERKKKIY